MKARQVSFSLQLLCLLSVICALPTIDAFNLRAQHQQQQQTLDAPALSPVDVSQTTLVSNSTTESVNNIEESKPLTLATELASSNTSDQSQSPSASTSPSKPRRKLKFVIEVVRHGARSPCHEYLDKEIWQDRYLKCELTEVGARQHYFIGHELRKRYVEKAKFLKDYFDPNEIYVRTTDTPRTIQSAQAQMMGFFPEASPLVTQNILNTKGVPPMKVDGVDELIAGLQGAPLPHNAQTIPIRAERQESDFLVPHKGLCSNIHKIHERAIRSATYQKMHDLFKEKGVLDQAAKVFKLNASEVTFYNVRGFADAAHAERYFTEAVREGLTEELRSWLTFGRDFDSFFSFYNGEAKYVGLFASKMLETYLGYFDRAIEGRDKKLKFAIFSAHVETLNPILLAMGLANYTTDYTEYMAALKNVNSTSKIHAEPDFASNIIMELFEEESEDAQGKSSYSVRFALNDVTKIIPGCGDIFCDYKTFKKIASSHIIKDYDELCRAIELQI